MDLTRAQITKKRWNISRREYKRRWDQKNRPWRSNIKILKETDPKKYEILLKKKKISSSKPEVRERIRKYNARPERREKQKIYIKRYREKKKLDPIWVEKERLRRKQYSRYNPIAAKKNREKHKKNKTHKWQADVLRKNIHNIFRERSTLKYKKLHSQKLLGASHRKTVKHIESLFQSGMSWNNYGKWHIDHIVPCFSFDLKCPVQQLACCHYTNLQPLWACDNLSKGKKINIASKVMGEELKSWI